MIKGGTIRNAIHDSNLQINDVDPDDAGSEQEQKNTQRNSDLDGEVRSLTPNSQLSGEIPK